MVVGDLYLVDWWGFNGLEKDAYALAVSDVSIMINENIYFYELDHPKSSLFTQCFVTDILREEIQRILWK